MTQTIACPRPVLGCCGFSGSGKTTLLAALIPRLQARGLRVAVIKHAHHRFDIDQPGKDSHRLRAAGAGQVIIASRSRMALLREFDADQPEPRLTDLLACLDFGALDLVLLEGFKHEAVAKLEVHRPSLGHPLLYTDDPLIIALATDAPVRPTRPLPLLDLNQPDAIAAFVGDWAGRD